MSPDLELALELAAVADATTLPRFTAGDLTVETKPDSSPVTDVDRGVEAALTARIAAARPGDGVIGEEFGTTGGGDRRWILDPIDGTRNYVRGIPVWATLVALEVEGAVTVGVVSAPALGRRWWAARGEGAYADGAPIAVSNVATLAEAQVCHPGVEGWEEAGRLDGFLALTRRAGRDRGFGDFWQHMLVAQGSAEVALDPVVNLWDLAALQVIVEEAGGRFTSLDGAATPDRGSAVSSNGRLHDEVLSLLARRG